MPGPLPTLDGLAASHGLRVLGTDVAAVAGRPVTGVTLDSRRVQQGWLYAALPGARTHGARFAAQAVDAGAVGLLTDAEGADIARDVLAGAAPGGAGAPPVPLLVTDDPRGALGPVSAEVNGDPSHRLALLGVTGTNGKTTVSTLVDDVLRGLGLPSALIGTIRARIGDDALPSTFTTPEAPDLQALLRRAADAGCRVVSSEVSSHALEQRRVDGTRYAVVAFTNLSRDHLDHHGTMAAYFAAKLRLFTGGFAPAAVVGVDDTWGRDVAAAARDAGLEVVTVGTAGPAGTAGAAGTTGTAGPGAARADGGARPDVVVDVVETTDDGRQRVRLDPRDGVLSGTDGPLEVDLPVPGAFNAVNAALAVVLVDVLLRREPGVLAGAEHPGAVALAALLSHAGGVPGRMERVAPRRSGADGAPLVVVDYAHTPDAVAGAVAALRPATPGRLVVVLGAGGDRDPGKRPGMGEAASAADLVVVTDDNPRGEDPAAVRAAVLAGVTAEVREVGDRAEAVRVALAACEGPADTVLVAGKGHETGQTVAGTTHPFDDREVARDALDDWLARRGAAPGGGS
ncbi:UDP-N-acetylmuramoyl-L-alanyl-D-glutamate--2,6-diaminopimelate ligase [Aquipuribacter sp. SD81]|uniref:UDP-N-acetylmuramoyl-L-alanyl-D-glutamate--2, 6-diaminopimelate ligase n=1 Tax=Aquipuribacter sp. SD81 TaxID=3127703 RepID=UPI0030193F7E